MTEWSVQVAARIECLLFANIGAKRQEETLLGDAARKTDEQFRKPSDLS